jgi:hypothetical protein
MPIPESQLESWSGRGAVTTSSTVYTSVQAALCAQQSAIANRATEIYLQGSYRNATNIYADSDVDIVVELTASFNYDLSALDVSQQQIWRGSYPDANYRWQDFRADVLNTLRNYYGQGRVTDSDRCIKVSFPPGRIAADVVPALQHRKYGYFYSVASQSHVDGVQFQDRAGTTIINFPKQHIANGEAKNSTARTNGWYKPTVRIFKNIRNRLVDDGAIPRASAPSYCVECLVYNAADTCFGGTYQDTVARVVDYLWAIQVTSVMSQNGITPLFGTSRVQWSAESAQQYLAALKNLWHNWQ